MSWSTPEPSVDIEALVARIVMAGYDVTIRPRNRRVSLPDLIIQNGAISTGQAVPEWLWSGLTASDYNELRQELIAGRAARAADRHAAGTEDST